MIGSRANLYLAKQLSSQSVTVDLSDLKPGTHQVNLKYKQAISNVEYKLDPSTVSVTISTKQSLTKEINTEITNLDKLDSKYSINSIKLTSINEKKDDNDKDADVEGPSVVYRIAEVVFCTKHQCSCCQQSYNSRTETGKHHLHIMIFHVFQE
jgi:copper chaperone CopZ